MTRNEPTIPSYGPRGNRRPGPQRVERSLPWPSAFDALVESDVFTALSEAFIERPVVDCADRSVELIGKNHETKPGRSVVTLIARSTALSTLTAPRGPEHEGVRRV